IARALFRHHDGPALDGARQRRRVELPVRFAPANPLREGGGGLNEFACGKSLLEETNTGLLRLPKPKSPPTPARPGPQIRAACRDRIRSFPDRCRGIGKSSRRCREYAPAYS